MTVTVGGSGTAGQPDEERTSRISGSMSLADHLRELRSRFLKSALAVFLGAIVGWIYYQQIFDFLSDPINQVVAEARAQGRDVTLTITDVAGAFTLQLKVAAVTGLILASPVWIYQFWRFVTPGLHRHEKRWAYGFVAIAVPLFLAGVVMAYVVLPGALQILFDFTPDSVANFLPVDTYLSFFIRLILVFGLGFLTPLIIVGLNLMGVLTGRTLLKWWRFIIFGVFLFAAVATPTADPFNLLLLATPILILVGAALAFCFINDRRRAKKAGESEFAQWGDDETSPL
ncbi:MAG: twin-arginine translocase subunit TatC [Actinobacteria bacterium]|nr:twin-arginine translocase subunit TatC [Actinomycetota bacterium]